MERKSISIEPEFSIKQMHDVFFLFIYWFTHEDNDFGDEILL